LFKIIRLSFLFKLFNNNYNTLDMLSTTLMAFLPSDKYMTNERFLKTLMM